MTNERLDLFAMHVVLPLAFLQLFVWPFPWILLRALKPQHSHDGRGWKA